MGHERWAAGTLIVCLIVGETGLEKVVREVRPEKPPHEDVKEYPQVPRPRKAAVVVSTGTFSPSGATFVIPEGGASTIFDLA